MSENNIIKGKFPRNAQRNDHPAQDQQEQEPNWKRDNAVIGIVSPGEMGAAVGAAAVSNGARVLWAGEGRSKASHHRAEQAGLTDCRTFERLASEAQIIFSICPPHDAEQVVESIIATGFKGMFVEANAISPSRAEGIAYQLKQHAIEMVDGGIVGGPTWTPEDGVIIDRAGNNEMQVYRRQTRLFLSGRWAERIEQLFEGSALATQHINNAPGSASAMKMCYAAYSKGSAALLAAILKVADFHHVRLELEGQWGDNFTYGTYDRLTESSHKAWRFAGEMREIADTFSELGLPESFHLAAAEIFERLAGFKDSPAKQVEEIIEALYD